jgi:FkbM family methyltransferase
MIEREPAFKWVLRRELDRIGQAINDPVLMDIGANVGDYTILMDKHLGDIPHRILAVEPEPHSYDLLCQNLKFHGVDCICDGQAIADRTQQKLFYTAKKSNLCSLIHRLGVNNASITVNCTTIPKMLKEHKLEKVNLIKMDIEGGEVLALRGARDFLAGAKDLSILMEVHPHLYTKDLSLEEELNFLFNSGWHCEYMISAAVPHFLNYNIFCSKWHGFEVKPGWERIVFRNPDQEDVKRYAYWEHDIGIPTWHGTLGKKLIRALLLTK